ncbi:MAG TPA: serine hydrolase domain-containing protein [Candidatus Cryosericum sp.]|nr:serine hydrolase domain-containing protein [Candidatus Cryosericum sp.]
MRRLLFILLTGFWMGDAFPAIAADVEVSSPPGTLEELDRQLAAAFVNGQIPGAAVALIEKGRIVFTKGYGLADKAQGTPVAPDTVFRAASISKSLTGIAVMVAVQEGKVSLDGRLQGLAPEVGFRNPWESSDPVRLVHLLEHTTGWPDISLRVLTADGKGWALQRGVQAASPEFVSRWKPGRFAVYNNAGPAVAGLVLEKVTGREFNIYVRERVLRPMGMATGDFDLTPELAARLAKSYDAGGRETPFQHIILPPAGSLNVSVKELAQLVLFFLGRGTVDGTGILTPESVARIERSESTLASRVGLAAGGYGLGNAPLPDKGVTFRGHNGGIDSFTSLYGYSLQNDSGYVLMANGGEGVDFAQPVSRLVQDYLTRDSPSRKAPALTMDRKALEGHAGLYRSITPSNTLTRPYQEVLGLRLVRAGDGRLVVGGNDYFPTSEHTFQRADRDAPSLAFAEDEGRTYMMSAFSAAVKEPLWRAVLIAAVLGLLALGAVIAVVMSPVWLIALARGRLGARGGALVRFLPLLGVVALVATFALPLGYLASGSIAAAGPLAQPGPYSYAIFSCSILFPLLGGLGLWRALRASDAGLFVRLHAGATSTALLAFAAYAAFIGWVGARTWTM